jgi:hydroxypyruvate reductase
MIRFQSPKLGEGLTRERRSQVLDVLAAALEAVDPVKAIYARVRREGDLLHVGNLTYDLAQYRHVYVIGGGKAGAAMSAALEEILGERLTAGAVNVKYAHLVPTRTVQITEAGHPIPDENGVAGTRRMVELARRATEDDLVLCVISGGGSALMTLPVEEVTLADMQALTDAFLRCGATINEINAVRKHLDLVKGGGLARLIAPAHAVSLILSDVVGNPLDVIASGPTVPDTATFEDACAVLDRYELWDQVPQSIAEHLRRGRAGEIPDTPKAGDPIFDHVQNLLVGSNAIAALAAVDRAKELGFNPLLLSTYIEGEAREIARFFVGVAKELIYEGRPVPRPACVVAGGETTVTIRGEGKGGRNQEMALAAAMGIAGLDDVIIACLATDGTDGPTDAAGALADGSTVARAQALGLDPAAYLADNDSYHFFEALGDLLITGPTNTNVNDLTFVFAW